MSRNVHLYVYVDDQHNMTHKNNIRSLKWWMWNFKSIIDQQFTIWYWTAWFKQFIAPICTIWKEFVSRLNCDGTASRIFQSWNSCIYDKKNPIQHTSLLVCIKLLVTLMLLIESLLDCFISYNENRSIIYTAEIEWSSLRYIWSYICFFSPFDPLSLQEK